MVKARLSQAPTEARRNGVAAALPMSLDSSEVMKAMMAASKDKGKAKSADSGSEGESDATDDEGDEGAGENQEIDGLENDEEESRVRRSRANASDEDDNLSTPGAGPSSPRPAASNGHQVSRVGPTSRVSHRAKEPAPALSVFSVEAKPSESTSFQSLGLSQPLISALGTINIQKPTEIQAACIRAIMQGKDCIGGAKTGSGKTLAFALPIVERIARDPYGVWAVVLTPTRELAYQLTEQFLAVGRPLGLKTITVVGGMDMMTQAQELDARPHIIVATPGRLCDLLRSDGTKSGKLARVKTLVLDEADRLLTPSFAPELAYLFSQIPTSRQTCLFTATVSEAIMDLANKPPAPGKQKPFVYRVASETMTVGKLKQKYLFIPSQIRDPYLVYLLHHPPTDIDSALRARAQKPKPNKPSKSNKKRRQPSPSSEEEDASAAIPSTIIFTQRCATAHLLHLLLTQLEIPSVPLHSHLTQPQRLLSLSRFRAREVPILVTTDVGSRGLDIPSVAMVINWDCPRRSDDYVHRVGRTARAGRGGVAVTIVTERDVELVQKIEEDIGTKMAEMELPEEEVLEEMNKVSLARRMATMEMHDSGFGERQATNKAKAIKRARRDAAAS